MSKLNVVEFTSNDPYGYPKHDINPKDKDAEWAIAYAKAAWWDNSCVVPKSIFFNSYDKYEQYRLYALGKQPVNLYKRWMGIDNEDEDTPLNIDWTVPSVISKFRGSAIDRVIQKRFEISCTPIDPTAKAELAKIYSDLRAKMAVRTLMQQQNPELAMHPLLMPGAKEPLDEEELQMRIDFGEQFNRSKDAEEVIALAFYKNGIEEFERKMDEDFFDCGVAGYFEGLDENTEPYFRNIDPENMVTNYCKYKDFRDLRHAGEVIDVSIVDLAAKTDGNGNSIFSQMELDFLNESIAGRMNGSSNANRSAGYFKGQDSSKVKVLQLYFYSYNDMVYRNGQDKVGNKVFVYHEDNYNRKASDKYLRKRIKVVYKINWIVGTELCYDFALVPNQKRAVNPKNMGNTELPYRLYASNFYAMRAQGYMERAIPFIDQYCMTWYRIQNFKARMVPAGWFIDLDAIESVALGKGGAEMTPKQLINFFFQSGVLAGRLKDATGDNQNYKGPIIPIENKVAAELAGLYNDLVFNLNQIEQICGGNSITSGNPNPKTLSPGYEIANESNDSALAEISNGRNYLINKLAGDMLIRAQQSIKLKGNYEGYSKAINGNTLQFISASESLPLKDYGIITRMATTAEERQFLIQQCEQDRMNGFLDGSDMMLIIDVYNFKQAQEMIAFKVKRNKQMIEAQKQAINQQTIQGQQQSLQMGQQQVLQLEQLRGEIKDRQIEDSKRWDFMIAQMKTQQANIDSQRTNQTKLIQHMTPAAENPEPSEAK